MQLIDMMKIDKVYFNYLSTIQIQNEKDKKKLNHLCQ